MLVPPMPPWMPFALAQLGQREIVGPSDNPRILEWLRSVKRTVMHDEVPNCSAYVNACVQQAGVAGTGSLAARSWLKWGTSVSPTFGCIAVFSRPPRPASGHCAFYVGETPTTIWVLGANQNNQCSFAEYPRTRLLAYRGH